MSFFGDLLVSFCHKSDNILVLSGPVINNEILAILSVEESREVWNRETSHCFDISELIGNRDLKSSIELFCKSDQFLLDIITVGTIIAVIEEERHREV